MNGKNLLRLPARDVYLYSRLLLDQLFFSKEQQRMSLTVVYVERSDKLELDQDGLNLLFGKYIPLPYYMYMYEFVKYDLDM